VSARGIPREEKGWIMPLIQSGRERRDQARESRGQKEDLQATLAKMHLKKRWESESSSVLQRGQRDSTWGMVKMEFNLALEGRMSHAIFQRKRISLAFSFSFERAFQMLVSRGEIAEEVLLWLISL
jgi:hypothetical protein